MNTIFITGSSSGIGYETVKLFAKNGWKVIATMRNTAKGEELGKLPNVEIVKLDVSNHAEIWWATKSSSSGSTRNCLSNPRNNTVWLKYTVNK